MPRALRRRYGRASFPVRNAIQALADETATAVISESTRLALEKITAEYAREMLADPDFSRELRENARESAKRVAESLRAGRGK